MDVVGSEIGQKMRSAIKAKLTELGCYVDDELPDYVMVMVANKRTRAQMEDDLQLFLGDNTELFVNWLHQVLKKLQEVTVTTPLKAAEPEKIKETSTTKEHKSKEKKTKEKVKKSDSKKAKKKEKIKLHRKKDDKKTHKSKKKSKHHDMIRPNIPPLLMNMEKESEPSITDVFAGQILKNHGITLDLDITKDEPRQESKPVVKEIKRPILPIIDPATILSEPEQNTETTESSQDNTIPDNSVLPVNAPREDQIDEINKIEAKIQGLKQKLVEQLDSMSDDEDFLNIRTEAEELMNDFAEDVFQEISEQAAPISTPPLQKSPTPPPPPPIPKPIEVPVATKDPIETLPQIELKLPKRPVRERLGVRELKKIIQLKEKEATRTESPERFTPEREPLFRPQSKSAKSRLGDPPEPQKRHSVSDDAVSEKSDTGNKKLTSRVSVLESRGSRATCASVVRVRPRPRVSAPASNLLLKAVADAHKSLLNIPPKPDAEPQKIKRALVLPMRRCMDAQKIVIQVPGGDNSQETGDSISLGEDSDDDKSSKVASDADKDEYIPAPITKKITNSEYTPSRRHEGRTSTRKDDTLIIETINIHNPTVDKDKNTQFIVTMDGFSPNAFLAKKLLTEGLLNDEEEEKLEKPSEEPKPKEIVPENTEKMDTEEPEIVQKKRLSNTSEESDTQVIIKKDIDDKSDKRKSAEERTDKIMSEERNEKRKSTEERKSADERNDKRKSVEERKCAEERNDKRKIAEEINDKRMSVEDKIEKRKSIEEEVPPVKKRKASPIVFDVGNKEKEVERVRQRTESASSDNHVIVTTVTNTHKYDSVPPLSAAGKLVWCRSFPLCRYGAACAFAHPRCKFAAGCTRRGCLYSHAPGALAPPATPTAPSVASHVVPAANYKSISAAVPNMCKYYPSCVNPLCRFYHPKPCRYGKACGNKLECNFYHADAPHAKWRYPV